MRAIIEFQRAFMLTQDDLLLQPLRLADVAKRASLDVSTISRVVSSKYALLDGVLFPLKHFFLRTKASASGHAVARNRVAHLLHDIIDSEDKRSPLTDEQISALMTERGEPISRRTVSKYRDSLGIPSAVMRKKI
jgi:RNA polymerase sigma-54 factor